MGECRYDVNPFMKHAGLAHAIESDLYNNDNESQGNIKLKLTYYSAEHGKLRLRIFHLSLIPQFVERFKTAKVRAKVGIHMQSTPEQSLEKDFDYVLELVILLPSMNLSFEVVNDEGLIASYTITNIEKSNLLQEQSKAYQVSLFNNDKAVGLIKYQVDWIRNKWKPQDITQANSWFKVLWCKLIRMLFFGICLKLNLINPLKVDLLSEAWFWISVLNWKDINYKYSTLLIV